MFNKAQVRYFLSSTYFQVLILASSFLILFHHTFVELVKDWINDDNYSHGFLIPPISAFLIWQYKDKLSNTPVYASNIGLLLLGLGLSFFVISNIAAELFCMRLSILIVLFGLVIYIGGKKSLKDLALPIGYLVFMIPLPAIVWNKIAFPLKMFATNLSTSAIQLLGIPVHREGNILHLDNMSLEVVDACSGLRSLTSLLALSAAFALMSQLKKTKKCTLFLSAIPIAILVNIIRLTGTAALAQYYGQHVAQGFLHEASGILVFILGLTFLFVVYLLLQKWPNEKNSAA